MALDIHQELWVEHALIAQAPDENTMRHAKERLRGTAFTYDLGDYQEWEQVLTFDALCPVDRHYLTKTPMKESEAMEYVASIWGAGSEAGGLYVVDDDTTRLFYQFQTLWRPPLTWFSQLIQACPDVRWDLFSLVPIITDTGMDYRIMRWSRMPGEELTVNRFSKDHKDFSTLCDKYLGVPPEIL